MSAIDQRPSGIAVLDNPVTGREKSDFVRQMFDDISPRYDLLNDTLSFGIHRWWRVFATRCAALLPGDAVLDVCSGTGAWVPDLRQAVGPSGKVVGADFSFQMLRKGEAQFAQLQAARVQADATSLPFPTDHFQAATVAFGIRNIAEIDKAFREMMRVVVPGGRVVCLEFASPTSGTFRALYAFYSRFILPKIGGAVSGRADAYTYLPASVARFASRAELAAIMREAGLDSVRWVDLSFGVVCVHVGTKPNAPETDRVRS